MISKQIEGFLDTQELWEGDFNTIIQFQFPTIDLKGFNPTAIPQNIRLGHQIEYIFKQLIVHSEQYKILVFNQAIRNEKRTIGEIDFIVQNNINQEIIHVELTYKFYLIDDTVAEEIHQLIGPNRKDAFFQKIEKIKEKQFNLLHTTEAIAFLNSKNIDPKNIVSRACFKAQIFEPYNASISFQSINQNCIVGSWLNISEFTNLIFKENHYYLLTKQEWIIKPTLLVQWETFDAIFLAIQEKHERKQTPMLWMKNKKNILQKLFIVWW